MTDAPHGWLSELLLTRGEDGALAFSRREVEDFFGAIFLVRGFEPGSLAPSVADAVVALADRAELDPAESPAERGAKLEAYFRANPIPTKLAVDFAQLLQEEIATSSGTEEEARAFLEFVDQRAARFEARSRPEGTRPGGALGFFLARGDPGR